MKLIGWFTAYLLSLVPLAHADDEALRIAVASNFHQTLDTIADQFTAEHPDADVILIPGSTGKLFAQIARGAPFHIFFSADRERPEKLEQAGIGIAGTRFTYAYGTLALWSPKLDLSAPVELLQAGSFNKFAIANPDLAPYGRASVQTLRRYNAYESTRAHLVIGANISQSFHFIKSGAAEIGFVSLPQLRAGNVDAREYWTAPPQAHEPIEQQAGLIKDTPTGRAFLDFCRSQTARSIIEAAGYGLPAP